LDEEQKDILRLACSRLNFAHKVGCDWGFDKTVVYGRGVSVLLYGSSGTGKTMAAQIMAAETGMELYRVDLSRLSSKYVGETEKNVSKLFEEAKNLNIILFFDEADSLFSKRTDITDSNDKFANAETAFILQQVEQYEGMCILATNLYKNFDSAFIRRISCVVKFSLPDEERRYLLWKSIIPEKAPVSPDLDLRFLAENFDMSGSEIKVLFTQRPLLRRKKTSRFP
jgi:SpoVK/Ycf46/Vps4 family AAA+-type ATPase